MTDKPFHLKQNIFKGDHPPIHVVSYHENNLSDQVLQHFLDSAPGGVIGVAPGYGPRCALVVLAVSTAQQVLLVRFSPTKSSAKSKKQRQKIKKNNSNGNTDNSGRTLIEEAILCHPSCTKYAFKMDRLSMSLYMDLDLRITGGVDLLSASQTNRRSLDAVMAALGGETTLHKTEIAALFKQDESVNAPVRVIAMQAWTAWRAGSLSSMAKRVAKIPRINTQVLQELHLHLLAKTVRDADRLDALKPTKVKNDVAAELSLKNGKLNVSSTRFKTRVHRATSDQTLEIETVFKGKTTKISGRAVKVEGRAATISLHGKFPGQSNSTIRSVSTIGKEDPTGAEGQRALILLKAIQSSNTLLQQPFVQSIYLPSECPIWPPPPSSRSSIPIHYTERPLNPSQTRAVREILSDSDTDRVTVIHGPPGTGKTTVIAAAVMSIVAAPKGTIWLIAHSNVAVKNIAEKLVDVKFLDFRLLVSKDFHLDWHEHLYDAINKNLVRSDSFPDDIVGAGRLLLGSRVILCTLSMLANDRIAVISRHVPVETVIVDEASQIEVGDYIPMLYRFNRTLRKLVLIGDDNQLAPYGQDDIGDLRSIFEMSHLRRRAVLLDTQYRMPTPIGSFISQHVYHGSLKTVHTIQSLSCCRLVDVAHGRERSVNRSWVNLQEVQAAVRIAAKYHSSGKSFRVITPYDPQRGELEKALKSAKLPWEDKCFNVDSFQGNEADHIIISLVRSDKLGFLKNVRRTNVMLTRCKRSMIICTSRAFIESNDGRSSLVGSLAAVLGPQAWLSWQAILSGKF